MSRVLNHLRSNVVAYVALFVALGGTSYAAISLPAGSVGNRQLKNHSITPVKLDRGSIAGYVRDWAEIDPSGQLVASRPAAHLVGWSEAAHSQEESSTGASDPAGVLRHREHGRLPPVASAGATIISGATPGRTWERRFFFRPRPRSVWP